MDPLPPIVIDDVTVNIDNSTTNIDNSVTNIDNSVTNIDNSVTNTTTNVDNSVVNNITNTTVNTVTTFYGGFGGSGFLFGGAYASGYGFHHPVAPQGVAYAGREHPSYNVYVGTEGVQVLAGSNITGVFDRDILVGGIFSDRLASGYGQDIMIGNGGADKFVLNAAHGTPYAGFADVIVDLRPEEGDFIKLKGINPYEVYYDCVGVTLGSTDGLARPDTFSYRSESGQLQFTSSVQGIEKATAICDGRNGNVIGVVLGDFTPTVTF